MDNHLITEEFFNRIKSEPTLYSYEETKTNFLNSLNAGFPPNKIKTKRLFTLKSIIMISVITATTLSILIGINMQKSKMTLISIKTGSSSTELIHPVKNEINDSKHLKRKNKARSLFSTPQFNSLQSSINLYSEIKTMDSQHFIDDTTETKQAQYQLQKEAYKFPVLTEKEIQITAKKKKEMLKDLQKFNEDSYSLVPAGSFDYQGKSVSTQAFYIGTTEVSNFEYRTFLFDLLIQGRKEEFLKAKPDQDLWKEQSSNLSSYTEYYFSSNSFDFYPVVNVSREGAELYCQWLYRELVKFVGEKKSTQYNPIRIPLRVEWVKAASNAGAQLPYAWTGPYMRNHKGFFQANFRKTKEEVLSEKKVDVTSTVKSHFPNDLGLFNMCGNAAEMVYENIDKSLPGTAGGSWMNTAEEIKIYAEDPNKGELLGKPSIGFRVVMTYKKP